MHERRIERAEDEKEFKDANGKYVCKEFNKIFTDVSPLKSHWIHISHENKKVKEDIRKSVASNTDIDIVKF